MRLSDIVGHAGLSLYAEIALVLFLIAFVGVAVWVFTSRRSDMERHARLPLGDGDAAAKESDHD